MAQVGGGRDPPRQWIANDIYAIVCVTGHYLSSSKEHPFVRSGILPVRKVA